MSQSQLTPRIRFELTALPLYYLIVSALVLRIGLDYAITAILFWGIPSIYFSLKRANVIRINLAYSLLFSITLVPVLDYIAHISGSWYEATGITGIRLLSVFPADALIWGFLYSYFIISFYEYYLDRHKTKFRVSKKIRTLVLILLMLALAFSAALLAGVTIPLIPYFYAILIVLLFALPIAAIATSHRQLTPKIVAQGVWFALLSLIYELTALASGQWLFPGSYYIGWVTVLDLSFPIEEVLWILLAVPAYICIYEYFADDGV